VPFLYSQKASAIQNTPWRIEMPVGPEVPLPLREYFTTAVADIAAQLGPDFTARLAFYGVTPVVPSGVPGDPAKVRTVIMLES